MNTDCFNWVDDTLNATVYTILRYGNTTDNSSDPTTSDWSDTIGSTCVDLDESLLVPVEEKDAQSTTDAVVSFNSSFGQLVSDGETYGRFFVNDTSYTNYIYQPILEGIASEGTSFINTSAVASAIFEDDVWTGDIIINNLDANLDHPYHLHGNEFQIVARGTGTLSVDDAASIDYNTTNPLRRDTLVIPGGDYAVLRISNDNPGVWVLHCHIAWHLAEGFLGIVVSRPNGIADIDFPSSMDDLCSSRPDFVSADTTEPGRRRRAWPINFSNLVKGKRHGINGHSAQKMRRHF
ncbi:Cupredoxin [Dendrothele bispora CBS 962.96]|uniref:Cupredoxin n=1 Tax=Dendrothele bispora (strain CBS 962.96) TaxID=1314807 RepID=A0A4S8KU13_DENBC|nr:Cupredoxin [Dendrothele bispora CBS 962.96]